MKKSMKSLLQTNSAVERIAGSYPAADRRTGERIYEKTMEKVRMKMGEESEHSEKCTVIPTRSLIRFRTAAMAAAVVLVVGATIGGVMFRFRPNPKKTDDPRPVVVEEHTRSSHENEKNEVTSDAAETTVVTTSAEETTSVTETTVVTKNAEERIIYSEVNVVNRTNSVNTETTAKPTAKNAEKRQPIVTVKKPEKEKTVTTIVTVKQETKGTDFTTTDYYGPHYQTTTTVTATYPTTTKPFFCETTTVMPYAREMSLYLETVNPRYGLPYVKLSEVLEHNLTKEKVDELAELRKEGLKNQESYPYKEAMILENNHDIQRLDLDTAIREIYVTYCNSRYNFECAADVLKYRQAYPDVTYGYAGYNEVDIYNVSSDADIYIDFEHRTIKYCGKDKNGIYIERYLYGNSNAYPNPFVSVSAEKLKNIQEYIRSNGRIELRKVMQMAGELPDNAQRLTLEKIKSVINSTSGGYNEKAKALYDASGRIPDIIDYYGDMAIYYLDYEGKCYVESKHIYFKGNYSAWIYYADEEGFDTLYEEHSDDIIGF